MAFKSFHPEYGEGTKASPIKHGNFKITGLMSWEEYKEYYPDKIYNTEVLQRICNEKGAYAYDHKGNIVEPKSWATPSKRCLLLLAVSITNQPEGT